MGEYGVQHMMLYGAVVTKYGGLLASTRRKRVFGVRRYHSRTLPGSTDAVADYRLLPRKGKPPKASARSDLHKPFPNIARHGRCAMVDRRSDQLL